MIRFNAPLELWSNGEGMSHFVTVPSDFDGEIRAHASLVRRGFGSVKVEVNIDAARWRTSIFPTKAGGYFLPIKIAVIRETGVAAGDELAIELELI
jgi:hypothetical protein